MNQVYSDYLLFTVLYRRNNILLIDFPDPQTPEKLAVVFFTKCQMSTQLHLAEL